MCLPYVADAMALRKHCVTKLRGLAEEIMERIMLGIISKNRKRITRKHWKTYKGIRNYM